MLLTTSVRSGLALYVQPRSVFPSFQFPPVLIQEDLIEAVSRFILAKGQI